MADEDRPPGHWTLPVGIVLAVLASGTPFVLLVLLWGRYSTW